MAQNIHSGLMLKNFDKLLNTALVPLKFEDSQRSWMEFPLEIRRFILGYLSFRDLLGYGSIGKHEYCALYSLVVSGHLRSLRHFDFSISFCSDVDNMQMLAKMLTLYPKLQTFSLVDSSTILSLKKPLENMSQISINDIHLIDSLDQLQELAAKLPSLTELELRNEGYDDDTSYPDGIISEFVKACSQLSTLALDRYLPDSVYMSLGGLQNLKTLTILSGGSSYDLSLEPHNFEALVDNFPPNLQFLQMDLDREYDMSVLRKFAKHLKNLSSLYAYANENDLYDYRGMVECTEYNESMPAATGVQDCRLEINELNAEKLFNIFRKSPLTKLTRLLLHGFSQIGDDSSGYELFYQERFPVLPLCFPNLRILLFLDTPDHLKRHIEFDHLEMMYLSGFGDEASAVCTNIAEKLMSLQKLIIDGDVFESLPVVCNPSQISHLEILASYCGYALVLSRMSRVALPSLKSLKVYTRNTFSAQIGTALKQIITGMPLLERLVHVQHYYNYTKNVRTVLDVSCL
eukprot:869732_1